MHWCRRLRFAALPLVPRAALACSRQPRAARRHAATRFPPSLPSSLLQCLVLDAYWWSREAQVR
mgnify:CR=1 FL=1